MSKNFLYGSIKYGVGVEPLASYITFLHEDKLSSSDDDNDEHINELLALHRDLSTLNKNISPIPDDILKSKRRRKSFCSEGEEEVYKAIEKKEPCKIQFCDPSTAPDRMWVQKVLVDDASGISDSDEDRSSIGDVKNDIKLQQDSKAVKSRAYKKDINASKFFTTGLLVNDNKHQVSLSSTSSLSSLEQKNAKMKSEKFERRKNRYRIRDTTKRNKKKTATELAPQPLSPISCEPSEQFESPAMQMTPPPYFSKSLPMQSYLMESPPFNMVPPMSLTASYTSPNYAVKSLTQIPFPINSSVIDVPSSSFPTNLSPSKALSFTDNSSLSDIMSLFNANSPSSENQHSSEITNSLNTATSEIAPTLLTTNSPSLEISSMLAEIPSSFHSNSSFEPSSTFAGAANQSVQNANSFPLTSSSLEMSYQPINISSLYAVNVPQINSMFTVNSSPKQMTSGSSAVNATSSSNAVNASSMMQMVPTTFSANSLHQISPSFNTEISNTINEAESSVAVHPAVGKSQSNRLVRPSSSSSTSSSSSSSSSSSYGTLNSLIEMSSGTADPSGTASAVNVVVQLPSSAAIESSVQISPVGGAKPRKRAMVRSSKKNTNVPTTEMFAASPFAIESHDDISFSTAVDSMSVTSSSSSSHKRLLQPPYSSAMNELMDRSAASACGNSADKSEVRSFNNAMIKPMMHMSTSLPAVNSRRRIRSFKKSANATMAELFSTSSPYALEQSCSDVPDGIVATAESMQLSSSGDSANRQKKKIRSSYGGTMSELMEKSSAFAYGVETSDEVHSAGSDTIESLQESNAAVVGSISSALKSRRRLPSSKSIADETSEIFSAAPLFTRNSCSNSDESITQMPSNAKLCEIVSSSDQTIDELMEMLNTSVAPCDDILSSDSTISGSVQISAAAPSSKSSAKIIRSFDQTVNEPLDMYAAAVESCAEIRNALLEPAQVSSSCAAAPSIKPRKRVARSAKNITNESASEIFGASSFAAVGSLSEMRSSNNNNPTAHQMCNAGFPTGLMKQSENSIRFSSNNNNNNNNNNINNINNITNGSSSSEILFPAESCNEMRNIESAQQMSHAISPAPSGGTKAHRKGAAGRCYNSGTYESTQIPSGSSSVAKSRKRINNNNKTQPIQMLSFYDLDESLQTSSSFNMLNNQQPTTGQMSQSFVLNELSHVPSAYNGVNQSESPSSSYSNMVNRLVQMPHGSPALKQSSSQISSPYTTINQLVQIMPSVTGKRTSQASSTYNQTVKIAPAKPLDSSNHHPVKIAPSLQKKLSYTMNRSVQTAPSSNAVPKQLTSSADQMVAPPSRTISSSNNTLNELSKKYTPLKPKELPKIYKPLSAAAAQKEAKRKVMQAQAKRKKMWAIMNKKEICKLQRSRGNKLREVQTQLRKVSHQCAKQFKQKALQSQRNAKEAVWRAKRLTKEMHVYWKRYDRVERENKRRLEKEAEEQRKMDVELFEVKRQQRKLNFLITQTELYAHFMSRKLGQNDSADPSNILNQLDEERGEYLYYDTYDSESLKEQVRQNVLLAFQADKVYSNEVGKVALSSDTVLVDEDRPQPKFFQGVLKHYQLKGMNWIANLYDQGINGILADEMGLGKTVQTIAFLCHITEKYDIWGPFLIITPSSTLHNWQQEFARFAPIFKVVPYWGNLQERKILRQFWELKDIHTQNASFHVVITNYQLVVTDIKYLNKIEWQYLVLDEAQAIKSANSQRWKMLLEFKCRNRLLLSGTPIQNNMAELWALLHFIMPSMFDSHDEFNEWFSKDIESHAENKTNIDEKHLNRLRMILKPFMLRRIKKDVENELSDKMEIMVYCPLTSRQKMLYSVLKKKIRIEDLLHGTQYSQLITSKLMNLVMQFRKVCNHPELFERREPSSPAFINNEEYTIPKLVCNECIIDLMFPGQQHIYNKFNIFSTHHINKSLFPNVDGEVVNSSFSFSRFINFSPNDINRIVFDGVLGRWIYYLWLTKKKELLHSHRVWEEHRKDAAKNTMFLCDLRKIASKLIFRHNATNKFIYSFGSVTYRNMPETMEHRLMRSIKANGCFTMSNYRSIELYDSIDSILENSLPDDVTLLPEFRFIDRGAMLYKCVPLYLPSFLFKIYPKAVIQLKVPYCCSRRFVSYVDNLHTFSSEESYNYIWYGHPNIAKQLTQVLFNPTEVGGLEELTQTSCKSNIDIPDKQTLVTDSGKLSVLDGLLKQLKEGGHRVLIYSQMTKMIDILEEYMVFRKHRYMRLDGTSKISERRDMVQDFQTRSDIFVFLLSTRAGGVGINLTAADTVVFYDSDWNPTVDEQAMDRAHRLGQTKQVTVYRLICKDSIEERILQRAQEKSAIQRIVISGESMKADMLKPKEVVSLLLDDEEIERKYREKQLERRLMLEQYHTEDNSVETNNEEEEIVQVEVVHEENDAEGNDKGEIGAKTKRNEKDNNKRENDSTEIKNDKLENNKKENTVDIKNNGAENGRYTMEEHNYSLPIDNLIVEEYADLELCIQEEVIEQELPDNVIEIYTNSDTPSPEVVVIPPPFSNKYIRKRGRPPLKNRSERPIPAKKPKLPIKSDPTTRRGRGRPRLHRPSGLSSRNTQSSPSDHNFHVWPEDN